MRGQRRPLAGLQAGQVQDPVGGDGEFAQPEVDAGHLEFGPAREQVGGQVADDLVRLARGREHRRHRGGWRRSAGARGARTAPAGAPRGRAGRRPSWRVMSGSSEPPRVMRTSSIRTRPEGSKRVRPKVACMPPAASRASSARTTKTGTSSWVLVGGRRAAPRAGPSARARRSRRGGSAPRRPPSGRPARNDGEAACGAYLAAGFRGGGRPGIARAVDQGEEPGNHRLLEREDRLQVGRARILPGAARALGQPEAGGAVWAPPAPAGSERSATSRVAPGAGLARSRPSPCRRIPSWTKRARAEAAELLQELVHRGVRAGGRVGRAGRDDAAVGLPFQHGGLPGSRGE